MAKLHIGCGTVYLNGFINVDLPSSHCFLASERPDLVELYRTEVDNYYGRHRRDINDFRRGPEQKPTVCDRYGSFQFIPFHDNSVDHILSRQVIEHLSVGELRVGLRECQRVLTPGGIFRFSVPDFLESMKQYAISKDSFYIRHFEGPKKDDHGFHTCYGRKDLTYIMEESGFQYVKDDVNPHIYPALALVFRTIKV